MEYLKPFPHLRENVLKGKIYCYDTVGYTRTLTAEHEKKIREIERNMCAKVVCVIQTNTQFGVTESYVIVDEESKDYIKDFGSDGVYNIFAYVVSPICEESGSIGIKETTGLLRRHY